VHGNGKVVVLCGLRHGLQTGHWAVHVSMP
jgi:hypothetical protein